MYKVAHSLLNFPWGAVFDASTLSGRCGHAFKIHQQRCNARRRQQAFSFRVGIQNVSRGLCTWPPWVICAPASNHKIGNVAYSGVLLFTKSYKWKNQRWMKWTNGRLLRETMCFWRSPTLRQFQDDWPTDPITAEIITSQCGLTTFWLFSVISLQQFLVESFVIYLRNKPRVYIT